MIRSYGYLIGNQYLGNMTNTSGWPATSTARWHSPIKITEGATNALLADANHWGGGILAAPHCASGPYSHGGTTFFTTAPDGQASVTVGAVGGNVGYLDGSVQWKNLRQMKTNFASSYVLYFGLW